MALQFQDNTKEQAVYLALQSVIDPELDVNIIDLGLVYQIACADTAVTVDMTLSTTGCPLGDVILTSAESAILRALPGHTAQVNLVWEPQWTPDMVTEAGREALEL